MNNPKDKVVTLGTMGNKGLSKEPEMVELKRMVRDGELDRGRTVEHLMGMQEGTPGEGAEPVDGTHGTPAH